MKPPPNEDERPDPSATDDLLARIIPLRHRNPETPPPPDGQQSEPPGEDPTPRQRSIWDPAACEPVLRRRATPATATTPSAEHARRPRALDAMIAGAGAIITTALLLNLTALPGRSPSAPSPTTALETHTAPPASTTPHHSARPHPSSKHPATNHTRHATIPTTQPRSAVAAPATPVSVTLPARIAPATPSAPASSASSAETELGFER